MKVIRYTLCSFLLIVVLIFSCDSFQAYMYGFQGPYTTSFYIQPGISKETMLSDIENTAKEHQIGVVFFKTVAESNWVSENILYCTSGMKEYFEDYYEMREGCHKSVFSGTTYVTYQEFSQLAEEDLNMYPEAYFLIGEEDNIYKFKQELVDTYAGSLPYLDGSNSRQDSITMLLFLWALVGIIVLCTTYYNIISSKKEYFVKLTLGESPFRMIMKNIATDTVIITLVFAGTSFALARLYGSLFLYSYSVGCIVLLCMMNAGLYLTLLKFDIKLYNSNIKMSKRLLFANYVVKFILTFLVCISLAGNMFFVQRYYELKEQEAFYEQRKDYTYIQLVIDDDAEGYREDMFYQEFYHTLDIQVNEDLIYGYDNFVFVNSNLESYLLEKLVLEETKDIHKIIEENEMILFVPQNMKMSEEMQEDIRNVLASYLQEEEAKLRIERYQKDITWNIHSQDKGYGVLENPIIAYSTKDKWEEDAEYGGVTGICLYLTFVKEDMAVIERFCEENNCRYLANNVYEDYSNMLSNYHKGAMINAVLLGIQLVIQILLIFTIIKLEFESNRLELVLKKILGYSQRERFKHIYLVTLISSVLCMICIFIAQLIWKISYFSLAYVGAFVLMFGEVLIISVLFVRQEKENIQKTIKGGYI